VLRASALAGLTDFDGAITQVLQAITLDPATGSQTKLGLFQLAKENQEEFETAFRQAIATDPKRIPALIALIPLALAAQEPGREPPQEWIDPDAGHRISRLSDYSVDERSNRHRAIVPSLSVPAARLSDSADTERGNRCSSQL